jgi:hypothetical protein
MRDLSEEQAVFYAFGLLEPAESASFEAQLGGDPSLDRLVRELCEVQALVLALLARPPGRTPLLRVKQRILAEIATIPQRRLGNAHAKARKREGAGGMVI